MSFTDAQVAHFDNDNLHSAEDVIKISAKRYLERVIQLDARKGQGDAE